jgi:hypothetical protein
MEPGALPICYGMLSVGAWAWVSDFGFDLSQAMPHTPRPPDVWRQVMRQKFLMEPLMHICLLACLVPPLTPPPQQAVCPCRVSQTLGCSPSGQWTP